MADLNRVLSENLALALGLLALVVLIILLVSLVQSVRLGRALRAYRRLVGGGPGGSLGEVLEGHVTEVERVGRRLDELQASLDGLQLRTPGSLQHVGMVRFNPFDDTGSDQSFAIALLDGRHDGVVISSLHGRTNTRLFAKPVEDGASTHTLSTEEAEAIRIAIDGTGSAPAAG